ncbi:MAG: RNA-guided endonuclease InsQ/TnpB family protein [Crocosphaera sp.]
MYAIKRELKLNNKQKSFFAGCAGFSRFVYNHGLSLLKATWDIPEISGSDSKRLDAIKKVFTNITKKQTEYLWTNKYSSRIYQNAFRDLKKAFSRWRDPKIKADLPRFKKKKHNCSFTVDSSNGKVLVREGKRIKIPTLGTFRLKEGIPYNCVSQTFTISREAGKWYISLAVSASYIPEMKHKHQKVGIDLGIKTFATLSDGNTFETPSSIKKAKTKLGKIQWRNRNKVLGNRHSRIEASKNAIKYYQKLRKKHKRISNIREDFLQKTTTLLAKTYQNILVEDLNVKGMMANHKLSNALSNLGLYRFRELLSYKQECFGFLLTIVDRWFPSSKTCSVCGNIQDMPLCERVYHCQNCGQVMDRDLNASINLENWTNNADGLSVNPALSRRVNACGLEGADSLG